MKIAPAVLAVALLAGACGGTTTVGANSAAGISQENETERAAADVAPEPTASAGRTASPEPTASPVPEPTFCEAIDGMVAFPFDEYTFGDTTAAPDAPAIETAAASYRAVAAAAPNDAPYIVTMYFTAVADAVEDTIGNSLADLAMDPDHLPSVVIAGSIDTDDIQRYVDANCPDATLAEQPFTPLFSLAPDPLLTPSAAGFCATWATLEQNFETILALEDFDDRLAMTGTANETLVLALSLVEADAQRLTVAYLRLVSFKLANIQAGREATLLVDGLLWSMNISDVPEDLHTTCPEVDDPFFWLFPYFQGSDPSRAARPVDDAQRWATELSGPSGSLTEDGVVATVDGAELVQSQSISVEGDTTYSRFVRLDMSFDQSHTFTPVDLAIVAPDGTTFPADPSQEINLHQDSIRFPVNRDIETLDGWTLHIGDATLDL